MYKYLTENLKKIFVPFITFSCFGLLSTQQNFPKSVYIVYTALHLSSTSP